MRGTCWRHADVRIRRILYDCYCRTIAPRSEGLWTIPRNLCLAVEHTLPKGSEAADATSVVRSPEDTRPSDAKAIAAALDLPFARAMPNLTHQSQSAVRGRRLVDNVIELDVAARLVATIP